jgi:hypothetical protein
MSRKRKFKNLSKREQKEILDAMPKGLVEVSCPWWPDDHWEIKMSGEPFEEAYYRIKEPCPSPEKEPS